MSDRDLRIRVILDAMNKASGPLNAIRDASRKAGAAIRDTRADLTRLDKAQADIKGFRDLKRGLGDTETKLDEARRKVAALARQIDQADTPTRKLTSDFARAKREAADLGRTFDAQQRELQETRDRLQAVGVSTNNLVSGERRLATEVRQANARLAEQKRHFQDLQRSAPRRLDHARASAQADRDLARDEMRRIQHLDRLKSDRAERWNSAARYGTGIVGAAVAAGATATGIDAVVEDAQYEHMLTSIGQKADLTREQAQRLGETLRRIAPEVARLPGDMAEGADTLAGIGLLGKFDAIKDPEARFRALDQATAQIMRAAGRAATAYDAEQDDMVRSVAAGVQNLQIPAEKAQRILDIMAAGDNAGSFSMKAMAQELPGLTGAWGALGQTGDRALGQLVAGLETTRMLAGDDAEAANNLKNLILKLNSKELATNFDKFGINLPAALKKAKREGRDLLEVIAELTNKATKGDNDKIAQIFTDQQAQMAVVAMITKLKEYKGLRDGLMKSDGLVDKQFDERMNDKISKTSKLKAEWSNLEIEIGKSLSPLTDRLIDGATGTMADLAANIRARGLWTTLGGSMGGQALIPADVIKRQEADVARVKANAEILRTNWPALMAFQQKFGIKPSVQMPAPLPVAKLPAPPPLLARPAPPVAIRRPRPAAPGAPTKLPQLDQSVRLAFDKPVPPVLRPIRTPAQAQTAPRRSIGAPAPQPAPQRPIQQPVLLAWPRPVPPKLQPLKAAAQIQWPASPPRPILRPLDQPVRVVYPAQPAPRAAAQAKPPVIAPAVALGGLRQLGNARAAELARQNGQARQFQTQALSDQRGAAARSLGDAARFRGQMRATIGNSTEYSMLGGNMMSGLQTGMLGRLPGLLATMTSIGQRIRAAFRSDMQIKSPSRVFRAYGGYLTAGLAQGIEGGAEAPLGSLRRLSRRVIAEAPALRAPPPITFHESAVASSAKSGGQGASGARTAAQASITFTGPITFQIQQQPGEDGEALARRIAGEFQQMSRAAATRRASSYEDLD